jgi:hypothetical protein
MSSQDLGAIVAGIVIVVVAVVGVAVWLLLQLRTTGGAPIAV